MKRNDGRYTRTVLNTRTVVLRLVQSMLAALVVTGLSMCGGKVNEAAKNRLTQDGFDETESVELSKLGLSDKELSELAIARQGGLDGTAAIDIVKEMHHQNLDFDLGKELQVLSGAGFSSTALMHLVKMGAVRHWEADLRVMMHAGIGESTIVKIAARRFEEGKHDLLSGSEYAILKHSGMSDLGIEEFVSKKGSAQQMQTVEQSLRMGESEQAAMKKAGL